MTTTTIDAVTAKATPVAPQHERVSIARLSELVLRGEALPPPIARTLGMELVSFGPGRSEVAMEVDPERHMNPMGTVHGGVICDLADLAMGIVYAGTLAEGESFTTVELTTTFLRPVFRGRVTATGRLVHAGRSVGLVEADVTDDKGRLVARVKSTCMTLRGEQAAGR